MIKSTLVTGEIQLKRLCNELKKLEEFAFDTETNTLRVYGPNKDFKLVGISISWSEVDNYYIPVGHVFDDNQLSLSYVVKHLKPIFENPNIRLIGWNVKFDLHVLARVGIFPTTKDTFDGMIASWLCDENTPNGLKENTKEILGIDQDKINSVYDTVTNEEKKSVGLKSNSKATFDLTRIAVAKDYAVADSYFTWTLYLYYLDQLEKESMDKIYYNMYTKLTGTTFNMEDRGATVDLKALDKMGKAIQKDIDDMLYNIFEIAGVEFNPASSQQKAELLFGFRDPNVYKNPNENLLKVSFGFPIESVTKKGAPQATNDTLVALAKREYKTKRKREGQELVRSLIEFAKLNKLKSSFIDGMLEQMYDDGKVHPSFNIIGTTSGRFACSKPNLQQLPKSLEDDDSGFYELVKKYKIRSLFIGDMNKKTGKRDKIVAVDYDNLEMRVLTHFSLDELLLKMFEHGDDSHGSTAVNMFNLDCHPNECKKKYPHFRQVGKVLNFLLVYGGGAMALYDMLKKFGVNLDEDHYLKEHKCKRGVEVAQIYIDKYFSTYEGVSKFLKEQKKFAKRKQYVYTLVGRKRRLVNINSEDFKVASYEERLAMNQPIQGSAGDIVINAQNRIEGDDYLTNVLMCRVIIQVHDELVFTCPEENIEKAVPIIKHYMENPFGDNTHLNLPFTATSDFGDTYHDAK